MRAGNYGKFFRGWVSWVKGEIMLAFERSWSVLGVMV
jgi:hypothetical protein